MKKIILTAALLFAVQQTLTANTTGEPVKKTDFLISAENYSVNIIYDEVDEKLHVEITGNVINEMIISLINTRGQESFHFNLSQLKDLFETSIDLSNLDKGLYFFKIDSGDEIRLKKIQIN